MMEALQDGKGRSIPEMLEAEHARLLLTLRQVRAALSRGLTSEAQGVYSRLRSELERQLRVEEDVLLRELERLGMAPDERPTLSLWMEHGEIRALLDQVRVSLQLGRPARAALDELHGVLECHRSKESLLLRMLLQRVGGGPRVEQLGRRVQLCLSPF
jgi:hypothetical protein